MKNLLLAILVISILTGCATRQSYEYYPPKTEISFLVDREECGKESGYDNGGSWLFGPMIIILPVAIVLEIIAAGDQKDFQRCMMARSYTCTKACWDVDVPINQSTERSTKYSSDQRKGDRSIFREQD